MDFTCRDYLSCLTSQLDYCSTIAIENSCSKEPTTITDCLRSSQTNQSNHLPIPVSMIMSIMLLLMIHFPTLVDQVLISYLHSLWHSHFFIYFLWFPTMLELQPLLSWEVQLTSFELVSFPPSLAWLSFYYHPRYLRHYHLHSLLLQPSSYAFYDVFSLLPLPLLHLIPHLMIIAFQSSYASFPYLFSLFYAFSSFYENHYHHCHYLIPTLPPITGIFSTHISV